MKITEIADRVDRLVRAGETNEIAVRSVFEDLSREGYFFMKLPDKRVLDLRDNGFRLVELEGMPTFGSQNVSEWFRVVDEA